MDGSFSLPPKKSDLETIVYLENGRYNPSLKLAMDICKVFGKNVEEVFSFEEDDDEEGDDEEKAEKERLRKMETFLRKLVSLLKLDMSENAMLADILQSKTCELLYDTDLKVWWEGPVYLSQMYLEELNRKKHRFTKLSNIDIINLIVVFKMNITVCRALDLSRAFTMCKEPKL